MAETKELTAERVAANMVNSYFGGSGEGVRLSVEIAQTIRQAEERGRVEMREKCAVCAESGPSWATPQEAAFFIRVLATSSEDQQAEDSTIEG